LGRSIVAATVATVDAAVPAATAATAGVLELVGFDEVLLLLLLDELLPPKGSEGPAEDCADPNEWLLPNWGKDVFRPLVLPCSFVLPTGITPLEEDFAPVLAPPSDATLVARDKTLPV
jgi:hypothetical protein